MVGSEDIKVVVDQYASRKDQILYEACSLFAQHGFHKCTIEDIALKCGLTKTALYHYFKNKNQIFTEVVNRESNLLLSEMKRAAREHEDPFEQIVAFVLTRFHKMKEVLNLYHISHSTGRELLPVAEKCRTKFFKEESIFLQKIITEGVARGRFRQVKSDVVARMLIMAFKGIEADFLFSKSSESMTTLMKEGLDIFLHGLVNK